MEPGKQEIVPGKRYQVHISPDSDADFSWFNVLVDVEGKFAIIENTVFAGFYLQARTLRVGSPPFLLRKDRKEGAFLKYKTTEIKEL